MFSSFNGKNAHQTGYCALGRGIGGLATHAEQADDRRREDDLPIPLGDHMRPGSLHRVNRPAEVHAPVVIEILKGGVLEELAAADAGVGHQKVYSPEVLDGPRDEGTAAFGGGNIAVIRDGLASP